MSPGLADILGLVGRLDDAPGLDTPRERFRRFITEHVTGVGVLRDLLRQCQERLGDQRARARQDLILVLGRFLGFEAAFGSYDAQARTWRNTGHWRSRHVVRIAVDVRSEQTGDADIDTLAHTLAEVAGANATESDEPWVGLCITTPFFAARSRLTALAARRPQRDIRVVSLDSLLWLADMVVATRLDHDHVVGLLTADADVDFVVGVLRRLGDEPAAVDTRTDASPMALIEHSADLPWSVAAQGRQFHTGFWIARVASDDTAPAGRILDSVIVRRRLLAIAAADQSGSIARPGDWIAFLVDGAGVVGRAQLDGAVTDPSAVLRSGRRFAAVFRLREVTTYDTPAKLTDVALLDRLGAVAGGQAEGVALVPVTRLEFEALTSTADRSSGALGPHEAELPAKV